jgi:hypothetical protein
MFGKPKDENDHLQRPAAIQSGEQVLTENDHLQRPAAVQSEGRVSTDQASFISRGMTVVGKIVGEGPRNHIEPGSEWSAWRIDW